MSKRVVVIALGGNAILPAHTPGTFARQLRQVDRTSRHIADLIAHDYKVIITHGNGPQAGSLMIQQEEAEGLVPGQPLDICDAMTQGQIGYMLQNRLAYHLQHKCNRVVPVCTVITQVEVAKDDPGLHHPSKPVGAFHTEEEAAHLRDTHKYVMVHERPHDPVGWRRVVPSPCPVRIIEEHAILQLLDNHVIVITCGGGGIPVVRTEKGDVRGVEAVIDKDRTAALLGKLVAADYLMILTDVACVCAHWGTARERPLHVLTPQRARAYAQKGHFPAGSMAPKVEAACTFVTETGGAAVITSLAHARHALSGHTGTWIVRSLRDKPS